MAGLTLSARVLGVLTAFKRLALAAVAIVAFIIPSTVAARASWRPIH